VQSFPLVARLFSLTLKKISLAHRDLSEPQERLAPFKSKFCSSTKFYIHASLKELAVCVASAGKDARRTMLKGGEKTMIALIPIIGPVVTLLLGIPLVQQTITFPAPFAAVLGVALIF